MKVNKFFFDGLCGGNATTPYDEREVDWAIFANMLYGDVVPR